MNGNKFHINNIQHKSPDKGLSGFAKYFMTALLLSIFSACSWWMAGRPNLFKPDRLLISHQLHAENELDCTDCHTEVEESVDLYSSLRPTEETCLDCHDKEDNCSMCHSDVKMRKPHILPTSSLHFSHQAHMERVVDGCSTCHVDGTTSTTNKVSKPSMDLCLGCHNHREDYQQARCDICHDNLQRLPIKAVAEFSHTGDWIAQHGPLAKSQGASCIQCHQQIVCSECHSKVSPVAPIRLKPEEVGRTLMHRGDFAISHAIEARADGDSCVRCHVNSSCINCHSANGLTELGSDPRSPHPANYGLPGSGVFHGPDARMRIETCAACHDQGAASVCVDCHASGGVGGDPHPMGWRNRFGKQDISGPMCLACHR